MRYNELLKGYQTLEKKVENLQKELDEVKSREWECKKENIKLSRELAKKNEIINSLKNKPKSIIDLIYREFGGRI